MSKEGGGAGNNWASGYYQGEQVQDTLLDMMGEWVLWVGSSVSVCSLRAFDLNSVIFARLFCRCNTTLLDRTFVSHCAGLLPAILARESAELCVVHLLQTVSKFALGNHSWTALDCASTVPPVHTLPGGLQRSG